MKYLIKENLFRFCTIQYLKISFLSSILLLGMNYAWAADNKKDTSKPRIEYILISDEGNSDGYVTKTKTILPPTRTIYVTVDISNAKPGLNVKATMIGSEKNLRAVSGKNKVTLGGNIAKAFKFSFEERNWPLGTYKVEVTLSSGDTKNASFEIKK